VAVFPSDSDVTAPASPGRWRRTLSYLISTETHTFAFSIASQALLSFFPFIVLLLSLTRNVLHSRPLYDGLLKLLASYLPVTDTAMEHSRSFILTNLQAVVEHHEKIQFVSLIILLLTSAGIFLPLEVALNRIWGAQRNRTYLQNWSVATGLTFGCGVLGMLSASFTALTETYSTRLARFLLLYSPINLGSLHHLIQVVSVVLIRAGAVPFTIAVFFLIYWWLPVVKVPARRVLPAAIITGLMWEASKYVYILMLPWLNFREIYGPFAISVSLVMWAFISALILLTGIELVAETTFDREAEKQRKAGARNTAEATDSPAGPSPSLPGMLTESAGSRSELR
jgi:YihY family inner membrane protein